MNAVPLQALDRIRVPRVCADCGTRIPKERFSKYREQPRAWAEHHTGLVYCRDCGNKRMAAAK